jgi:hypothetical protein
VEYNGARVCTHQLALERVELVVLKVLAQPAQPP